MKSAKKKVLVTGGGGYVGQHVIQALLDLNVSVYVADPNYSSTHKDVHKVDAPIFSGHKDIFKQLGSPDVLLHLAWQDGFQHNSKAHILNLPKHYEFIENMIEGGLKQVVGMGTMHEVGYYEGAITEDTPTNPQSLYGIAKNALRQITELVSDQNSAIFQWIRAYYLVGDDMRNHSVFRKLIEADQRGDEYFPFVSGEKKYDFINIDELGQQIAAVTNQTQVTGIINCCSGKAISLGERAEQLIKDNNLKIRLKYGAFPDRPYDPPKVWGDTTKITKILSAQKS